MTARKCEPHLLSPAAQMAAAERILLQPSCNVQRVATDEIYTFAIAMTQFAEVAALAASHLAGTASPGDLVTLRTHLTALGVLPPSLPPEQGSSHDES